MYMYNLVTRWDVGKTEDEALCNVYVAACVLLVLVRFTLR